MKIKQTPEVFRPITIVLESQSEVDDLYLMLRGLTEISPSVNLLFDEIRAHASKEARW
jgi:hypothetical protein